MAQKRDIRDETTSVFIDVWCDGGCSGNPGPMSIGIVMVVEINGTIQGVQSFGMVYPISGTNNQAEYYAFIKGLEMAKEECLKHPSSRVNLFLDSQLVYMQMRNDWVTKEPGIKAMKGLADRAIAFFDVSEVHHLKFYKASRHETRQADAVAGICMQKFKDSGGTV